MIAAGAVEAGGGEIEAARPGGPAWAWLFGLAVMVVYLGNGRPVIGTFDTSPNELLPYAIIRGDGPFLDRFRSHLLLRGVEMPDYATTARGRMLSRYPLAPALIAVPATWLQILWLDRFRPGWDGSTAGAMAYCSWMSKNAAAFVAAMVSVILILLLERLGLGRVAVPTALAAALGSELWMIASQAPWGHGPAALALIVLMWLLASAELSRRRVAAAGLAVGILAAIRLLDVVLVLPAALWLLRTRPRDLPRFVLAAAPAVLATLAYNVYYFGSSAGGQAQLEALHPKVHGLQGMWGDLPGGAAGTLFSPARGLFVFSPWAALAILALPATRGKIAAFPAIAWLLCGLLPFGLLLSKYSVWWAGHTFGPRYWTETTPLLAILLAFALDRARSRGRATKFLFAAAIAWSIAVQMLGAFSYPSTWNRDPADVDRHHERLWDWRDTEILRCLREGRWLW